MPTLIYKIKLFDILAPDGSLDESIEAELETLREEGMAETLTGPLPQVDGEVAVYALFAIPALAAIDFDLYTQTTLRCEAVGVRWFPGAFEQIKTGALRAAWDSARE